MLKPILFLAVVFIALGCQGGTSSTSTSAAPSSSEADESIPFRKDGTVVFQRGDEAYLTIDVEIADTDSTIERGLMQRSSLPDLSGMLFLMPNEEPQQFWMSNTLISLDIIYINSSKEVVSMMKYTTPLSQEPINSDIPALYVIEVPGGFTDTHGIIEGDVVEF